MKLEIKGPIISSNSQWLYDYFGMEATSPKKVSDFLKNATGDIEVDINSGGGSVFAGADIYTALKSYQGNVKINVVFAASAASVIAMAGDEILISPTGQMMIHNSSAFAEGDYRDMAHTSEVLKGINSSIANAYRMKTKRSEAELLAMMDKETWLTPQQALEMGFVDGIMFEEEYSAVASVNHFLFPDAVVNKLRNKLVEAEVQQPDTERMKMEIELALNL